MSNKSYKSGLFKRIIDLGQVAEADVDDLVRIWRVGTGDEKAITLQNFVETVDADLGSGGLTLTEIITLIEGELGDFVTLNTDQTITGVKRFEADTILGDSSLDYVIWDNTSKTLGVFSQAQMLHKFRGGASGALNFGQYDVDGNASINNTSNAKLLLGTNNQTRVEIEADGDVLLKKVDNAVGDFVRIDATTGKLTKRTVAEVSAEIGGGTLTTGSSLTLVDSTGGATYVSSGNYKLLETDSYFKLSFGVSIFSSSGIPSGKLRINGLPTMTGASSAFQEGNIMDWIDANTYSNKTELRPKWYSSSNYIEFIRIDLNITDNALLIPSGFINGYVFLYK